MAERVRSENGPITPEAATGNAVARIEAREAVSVPAGTEGFKGFIIEGGKGAGITLAVLLGLAVAAILKTVEVSARLMQGIVENPDKPEKWLGHVKEAFSFKKDKK